MDTMRCPVCKQEVQRHSHEGPFVCKCGWRSSPARYDRLPEKKHGNDSH